MPTGVPGMGQDQIREGFALFFHNKHRDAEIFFKPLVHKAPLFALGYAANTM